MSVARIITRVKQDADELARDLRQRGFQVDIVSPDEPVTRAADLEISLEECSTEQALRSAETLPAQEDVCVFIAPAALVESARPMVVVPLYSTPLEAGAAEQPMRFSPEAIEEESPKLPELVAATAEPWAEPMGRATVLAANSDVSIQSDTEIRDDVPIIVEAEPPGIPAFSADQPALETVTYRTVLRLRMAQSDKVFGKVATAVAIVSVCGLLLTMGAHSVSPVPAALERTATVNASSNTKPAEKQLAVSSPAANQQPVTTAPAAQPVNTSAPTKVVAYHPPAGDDYIAKDTVVHFARKPAPRPTPVAPSKKPGIKYYTDLK